MAENARDISEQSKTTVDKDRFKVVKDRQNEERQKKLEEIKAQALAAQRFREQKEFERRRRIEDLKGKEDVRRTQVEERKRAIEQAEQDRLVSILRRNQERDARIESKKRNERSSNVFAFGSSTPRMLDPSDMSASYWGHRRATSIQNISLATSTTNLTRRQSERELDGGSKKRATSAGGLERAGDGSAPLTPAGCASGYVGRRRTDLMPTIPSRESPFATSRKSLNHSPGRAYSMSRLDQLAKPRKRPDLLPSVTEFASNTTINHPSSFRPLSSPRESYVTRSMSHLAVSKAAPPQNRKQLNRNDSRSMHQLLMDGPILAPRTTRATQLRHNKLIASSNCSEASSRPSSSLSQQSTTSVTSSVSVRHRPSVPRRQRPASIAITGISQDIMSKSFDPSSLSKKLENNHKPPLPKTRKTISKDRPISKNSTNKSSPVDGTPKSLASPVSAPNAMIGEKDKPNDSCVVALNNIQEDVGVSPKQIDKVAEVQIEKAVEDLNEVAVTEQLVDIPVDDKPQIVNNVVDVNAKECLETNDEITVAVNHPNIELNLSNIQQVKKLTSDLIKIESSPIPPSSPTIDETTPIELAENAKNDEMSASVTNPRRLNTEEEAKAALAERRRLIREEAERQAELERARAEAEAAAELERQRNEEEQIQRMVAQQRAAEQERLEEAIKETQRRDEEERARREEEQRSKLLKEEADRKAKEEAEKKLAEQAERIKNEEKEREARRKRVEAIMRRTRTSNANSPSQNSEDKNENKSENKMNGTKSVQQENGTNGKDVDLVDNIIPDDTVKNANTVSIDTINSTDSINSNNSWQATQQYDSLM